MAGVLDLGAKLDEQTTDRIHQVLTAALGEDALVSSRDALGAELCRIVMECNSGEVNPMAVGPHEDGLAPLLAGKGQPHQKAILYSAVLLLRLLNAAKREEGA